MIGSARLAVTDAATSSGSVSNDDWHACPVDNVVEHFETDPSSGLSAATARQRLSRYGPKELEEASGPTRRAVLFGQFADVLIGTLFVAAAVSFAHGEIAAAAALIFLIGETAKWLRSRGAGNAVPVTTPPIAEIDHVNA